MYSIFSFSFEKKYLAFIISALLVPVLVNVLFYTSLLNGPVVLLVSSLVFIFLVILFKRPNTGFIAIILICFLSGIIGREVISLPYSLILEGLLLITLISSFLGPNQKNINTLNNDLMVMMLAWLLLSLCQIINPERPNIEGAIGELRTIAVYPFIITLISFRLIKSNKDVDYLLVLFLVLSLLACFGGIKQQHFGLSIADQEFLDNGGATTHLLWGKLRVFSFYDAARFGCLMAQFAMIALILSFGKYRIWKKTLFLILACLFIYGMLISGTRTAFIVIVTSGFFAILVSKNFKILFLGSLVMILLISFLKFTTIGNGNYEIYRLRSAVNPDDPSLNVRFSSQQALSDYMFARPFGAGLGVIGYYGHKFNSDKFPSTIEPDSFWVKVWVMYGIVGMIIWFGIYMYIFGKCFGIIWTIKDSHLRIKLIALSSSSFGIFLCSYGNEIINTIPSLLVVAVSLVIVYKGPQLDQEITLSLTSK